MKCLCYENEAVPRTHLSKSLKSLSTSTSAKEAGKKQEPHRLRRPRSFVSLVFPPFAHQIGVLMAPYIGFGGRQFEPLIDFRGDRLSSFHKPAPSGLSSTKSCSPFRLPTPSIGLCIFPAPNSVLITMDTRKMALVRDLVIEEVSPHTRKKIIRSGNGGRKRS